ncbi:MAG: chemotaxis protein CheW [Leptolyngbyaceae cyanobacterium CRU_2_3]|nr:chemotaxis protein CheW [Leptolyngbyaceae cyanobacterium CRU_2_3]
MSDSLSAPESQSLPTLGQDLIRTVPNDSNTDEQFLRLHLVDTPVLLPITQLTEVLTIPMGQIVPISHMPAWVMGVYNWRGEVLWMIDLGHLCGLAPWYEQIAVSAYSAVVLQIRTSKTTSTAKTQTLGLVVSQIGEMEWCNPSVIQRLPTSMTPEMAPFLRGYWWNEEDNDMLAILDGQTIFQAVSRL